MRRRQRDHALRQSMAGLSFYCVRSNALNCKFNHRALENGHHIQDAQEGEDRDYWLAAQARCCRSVQEMRLSCPRSGILLLAIVFAFPAMGREDVYLSSEQFINEIAGLSAPKPEILWLTKDIAIQATRILGHAPAQLRQRYWTANGKTIWMLEEIGKEEPISAGFVVDNGKIVKARVLVYRESRGGEIRYPAFLKQYEGSSLVADNRLDRGIDSISGATLSVRAMERMARMALYLDRAVREKSQ